MAEWIGETFTSDVGWTHLEELVDVGDRMAGSQGERAAAQSTRAAFEDVGARDVCLRTFEIQGWERRDSAIEAGGSDHPCIALPRSPADRATGELVDLGHGLPEDYERDLDGAVVLAASDMPDWYDRYVHRREKYYRAVEAGASAFVYRNHVEGCLPPTGSVGTDDDPIGPIPAVGVSKEAGARLARRFGGEHVRVEVDAAIEDATSQNVHGDLGPDTQEAVLLTSHVDAHDIAEGAMDNAAGTAMVLEVANALAAREDDLDTRVHLVAYGAEEVGLLGSEHHAAGGIEDVHAVLNNDGVCRGRDLLLHTHGFDELEDAIAAVAGRFEHPIETTPEQNPHSDHWPFVREGVPGIHARSETGGPGRGWGHTAADTIDKLEPRDLREQAILLAELAVELAERKIARRDPEDIAAALEDEDLAEGMRVIGDWPY